MILVHAIKLDKASMSKLVASIVLLLSSFGCTDHKAKPYEGRLDKDYELVVAHVAPDEDREFPIEVFVGRLHTIFPDSTDAANLQDHMMRIQLRAFVDEYQALLTYHDDAEVYITAGDQTVRLEHVGKGTYRDVADALHVYGQQTCALLVKRSGGKTYQGIVKVPGDITINNISVGDTVLSYPKKETPQSSICYGETFVSGSVVTDGYVYRFRMPYLYGNEEDIVQLWSSNRAAAPIIISKCGGISYFSIPWTSMALDTNLTRAWGMRETTSIEPAVWDSMRYWRYYAPITYRSNITDEDGDKIAGYFGAYNSVKTNFVVKVLRDSCECE